MPNILQLATFSELMNDVAFRFTTLSIIFSISFIKSFTFESEFPPTVAASTSGHDSKECGAAQRPRRISLMRPTALAAVAAWKKSLACRLRLLGVFFGSMSSAL